MKMKTVRLKDISKPKQWKNLPISKLKEEGYPVYGANGIIGYYDEYNHKYPTLAITCRGATCGNIHLTKPKSYITSNAMALDELNTEEVDLDYLRHILKFRAFKDVITGAAQPQITRTNLEKIKLIIPETLDDQIKIANRLTQVESLIAKREESIELLDELLKSTFLDMFGDPYNNKKQFEVKTIRDLVTEVKYGTSNPAEENGKYTYLRMNNIDYNGYWDLKNLKYINMEDSHKEKYLLKKGDLVFNRTNSKKLVGKTAVYDLDKEVIIAGYLIRVRVNKDNNPWFIWGYLNSKIGKKVIYKLCRNIVGMANINAQELQKIKILQPPKPLQDKFATIVQQVETTKAYYQDSLDELNELFGSLSQRAFRGELELSCTETIPSIVAALSTDEEEACVAMAYIIDNVARDKLGRVKLQKILFMHESINNLDYGFDYKKCAMGPYDKARMGEMEAKLLKARWFRKEQEDREKGRIHYVSLEKKNEYKARFVYLPHNKQLEKLVKSMQLFTLSEAEIVATLYAVWKQENSLFGQVEDIVIIGKAKEWHEKKRKYINDQWKWGMRWLRENKYINKVGV